MNNRVRTYLPLSLLLSTMIYAMDKQDAVINGENTETNLTLQRVTRMEELATMPKIVPGAYEVVAENAKRAESADDNKIHLLAASIPAPQPVAIAKNEAAVQAPADPSLEVKNISKSKVGQWFRDSSLPLVGRSVAGNVINELENGKFDKNDVSDMHRLENSLQSHISIKSADSLQKLDCTLALCEKQVVPINNEALAKKIYAYSKEYRKQEEGKVKEDTLALQKQTLDNCLKCVKNAHKALETMIAEITTQSKTCKEATNTVFAAHQPTIQVAYKDERHIAHLNSLVQLPDDYKIAPEACDTKFLKGYLDLTQLIQDHNDKIELITNNLNKILGLFEFVDKKAIEQVSKAQIATQPAQQPQQ